VKRLSDLKIGEEGTVINVAGDDDLRIKIMEMGITNNTKVKVIKKAPLNDPIVILLRNYELILRKEEANIVVIQCQ